MSDEEKHFSALSAACVLDDHVSGRFCMLCVCCGCGVVLAASGSGPPVPPLTTEKENGADELGNRRDAGDTRVAALRI